MTRLRLASWQPTVAEGAARPVNIRALAPRRPVTAESAEPVRRYGWLLLAVIGHVAAFMLLQPSQQPEKPIEKTPPMLVSLIAEPAPQPAVEPPKPVTEPRPPKVIPKKVVVRQAPKPEPKPEPVVDPKPEPVSKPEAEQLPPPVAQEQEAPAEEVPAPAPPAPQITKTEPAAAPEPQEPVVEPPRFGVAYLKNPPPVYPALSRRLGEEGRVVLRVLVTVDGKPETVEIENGSGSKRLDDAALDAVKKWKFIPARRNNESISAYVLVPLKFALNG